MKKLITIIALLFTIQSMAQNSLFSKDTLAQNSVFRQRVKSASVIAANQIAADTSKAVYIQQYSNILVGTPDANWLSGMTYQVVSNPSITYESSDNDIQYAVNSNYDKCAKAYFNVTTSTSDDVTKSSSNSESIREFLNRKLNIPER
jgi:hypothetical protein